jgi:hypothetical protein
MSSRGSSVPVALSLLLGCTLLGGLAGCGGASIGDPIPGEADAAAAAPADAAVPTADAAGGTVDAASDPPPDAPPPPPDARVCAGGDAQVEDPTTGTCYIYIAAGFDWFDAQAECEALGGHLAVPTSTQEVLLLTLLVPTGAPDDAWLGGTDEGDEMNWRWVNGEPFEFTNWRSGEPNDGNSGSVAEDCMVLEADNNGLWDDKDCVRLFPSLCEIP